MKKTVLVFCCLLATWAAKAQFNYTVGNCLNTAGTYTDLGTNGSVITTANNDDANSAATPIGFNFVYNGTTYTDFILNTNGFIKLGTVAPSAAALFGISSQDITNSAMQSTNAADVNILAPFNHDLTAGTATPEFRVYTTGAVGSRVCTIQWKNMRDKTTTPVVQFNNINFQIKLYETTNKIEFQYGTFTASANATNFKAAAVGIKGSSNAPGSIIYTIKGSAGVWSGATFQQTPNGTTQCLNFRNTVLPDAGRTFVYNATLANDATVSAIYTLGKVPIPHAAVRNDSCAVTNVGSNTMTNVSVTLNITGANTHTNTQTIASLAPNTTAIVVFPTYTLTTKGTNTVTVSLSSDDNNLNNDRTVTQVVNDNTWSYAYGTTPAGGVGFTGASGNFVARFNTSIATDLTQVTVNFTAGGQPYQIGVWDATGAGGTPGALIWTSTTLTSTTGANVIPINPSISLTAGDFFIGVRQTGTTNVSFAYQSESPIRNRCFYYSALTPTTWTDFAPGSPFRFMIEPKLILPIDANVSNITYGSGSTQSCGGGSTTVNVTISNTGSNTIAANTASVTLKVSGANTFTATQTNASPILTGGSLVLSFNGVPNNAGTNNDTAFVVLAGDGESQNDTTTATLTGLGSAAVPVNDAFDLAPYTFGFIQQVAGTGNWAIQTGTYNSVAPYSGTSYAIFNSYSFASGTISRLVTNCLTLPANGASSCNNNTLSFYMSHSSTFSTSLDSVYAVISIDGGATWTRLAGYGRYDVSATTPIWLKHSVDLSAYQNQTVRLGLEGVSKFGDAIGIDNIFVGSAAQSFVELATSTTNATNFTQACTDNGWTYYYDGVNADKYLFAINWDPTSTGANTAAKAAATATITVDPTYYSSENAAGQIATYTMRRYWNVDLNNSTMTGPVHVRFFYDSTEVSAVNSAVPNFIALNGGTAKTPSWFKTKALTFNPTNASIVSPAGIAGSIGLADANTTNQRINNIAYAEFQNVTSFSGGTYGHGVGANNLLPLNLLSFKAKNQGNTNLVYWSVSSETDVAVYTVEKSMDGINFSNMTSIPARSAQNGEAVNYNAIDNNPYQGNNYYRLRMTTATGDFVYSNMVMVSNKNGAGLLVFPNPAKDVVNIQVAVADAQEVQITVQDVAGKLLYRISKNINKGTSTIITLNDLKLLPGQYIFNVTAGSQHFTDKITIE